MTEDEMVRWHHGLDGHELKQALGVGDEFNNVYVIEVNPRSSRTVPFLSKATGVPMANIATKVISSSVVPFSSCPQFFPA